MHRLTAPTTYNILALLYLSVHQGGMTPLTDVRYSMSYPWHSFVIMKIGYVKLFRQLSHVFYRSNRGKQSEQIFKSTHLLNWFGSISRGLHIVGTYPAGGE